MTGTIRAVYNGGALPYYLNNFNTPSGASVRVTAAGTLAGPVHTISQCSVNSNVLSFTTSEQSPRLVAGSVVLVGGAEACGVSQYTALIVSATGLSSTTFHVDYLQPDVPTKTIGGTAQRFIANESMQGVVTAFAYNDFDAIAQFSVLGAKGTANFAQVTLIGMNNFVIACGAEVTAVHGATPLIPSFAGGQSGHPEGDGGLYVEANNCNWPTGRGVSQPNFYSQNFTLDESHSKATTPPMYTAGPRYAAIRDITGAAWQGGTNYEALTFDSLKSYSGYGGTWDGHKAFRESALDKYKLYFDSAPIQGGLTDLLYQLDC